MKRNNNISFILQPFVNFDKGYQYKNHPGQTEIRMIYLGQKNMLSSIKMKYNKKFISRYGSGCEKNEIPKNVKEVSDKIATRLNKKNAFFTLDFIVSNMRNVFLLEANTSPGIWWDVNFPEHIKMKKEMIDLIVEELLERVMSNNRERFDLENKLLAENNRFIIN